MNFITKHRVRLFSMVVLLVVMGALYWNEHHQRTFLSALPSQPFHYGEKSIR